MEHNVFWHSIEIDKVFSQLSTTSGGLFQKEAEARLTQYGSNRLTPPKRKSPFFRFLEQFHNVLIYVLLVAGGITALLGHWIDSGVIFGVVVINAVIGFIQEGKAEKALDAIRHMLSQQAMVKRDGNTRAWNAPLSIRLSQLNGTDYRPHCIAGHPAGQDQVRGSVPARCSLRRTLTSS